MFAAMAEGVAATLHGYGQGYHFSMSMAPEDLPAGRPAHCP